jgi:putative SOS response-associated peptidase YedK
MCNLYTLRPWEVRHLIQHHRLIGREWAEVMSTRNDTLDVYPNHQAAVVVDQDDQRVVREMLWGFPPFKAGAGLGTNFRTLNNRLWRDWLDREHRCVVPASAFAEPDKNTPKGSKEWRWFERAEGQPFFFAGIWRPWTGDRGTNKAPKVGDHTLFSIMTTEPNGIVEPIHEKAMPVLLMTSDDIDRWLHGSSLADALAMQKPAPDDAIVMRPPETKAA